MKIEYETIDALQNLEKVEEIWRQMLTKTKGGVFLSWEWVSVWLSTLPKHSKIELIAGRLSGETVIAFFIGKKAVIRHKLFCYRTASLNSTGDDYFDEISIECNGALVQPDLKVNIIDEICQATKEDWDELYLPGISGSSLDEMEHSFKQQRDNLNIIEERDTNSYYVDLKRIRDAGMDYLSLLSPNRRQQIRRSIREHEKQGDIRIHQAESRMEALKMLDNLAALHQKEWNRRGKPGAFSNQYFMAFHKTLIDRFFCSGMIQLVHIYNSTNTIGYLYNYVYDDHVLFYQCGFNYLDNNHARPGLISHYFTIMMNAKLDYGRYDFLAGNSRYKKSLATDHYRMVWFRLQRKSIRAWIEQKSKKAYKQTMTLFQMKNGCNRSERVSTVGGSGSDGL